ncbi:MAG: MFS transporter [Pelovirga sp.]
MNNEPATRKEIFGWAMFDFANQAYTLLIITVIYGDLFTRIIVGGTAEDYRLGNLLWSLALAGSYFLVVLTAPVLGAIMDFSAARKKFLFTSYLATVITTTLLYLVEPGYILFGMVLLIMSNYSYSVGESFIASFLTDLGKPEDLGKISGFGWALGYVGGLVATAVALLFLGEVSLENFDRIRWVGPFAGAFFLVAAIPTFLWLKERGRGRRLPHAHRYLVMGCRRVQQTYLSLTRFRDLAMLFASIFFAMSGIYIIIAFTFIYGAQVIRWDESVRVLMFVVVQITATLGALGFGVIQDRIGAKITYIMTLLLWIVAIILIYLTPDLANWAFHHFGWNWQSQYVFLAVGCIAGTCLGATQSAGRTLVGLFSPRNKAAEIFGFWGLFSKAAAIVGLVAIGLLQMAFGLQISILFCVLLFAAALYVALGINEARGKNQNDLPEKQRVSTGSTVGSIN